MRSGTGRSRWAAITVVCFFASAHPARAEAPRLLCHEARAPGGPTAVGSVTMVDAYTTTTAGIIRTAHVCNAAIVNGLPSADPDIHAATFELTGDTPRIRQVVWAFDQFGWVAITAKYPDMLLTTVSVGPDASVTPTDLLAWTCYRMDYPAFPNFYVTIEDAFTPEKVIRIRKPRLLCMPAALDGVPAPDPDATMTCYRQVPRLPKPDDVPVIGLVQQTPFAEETLDAGKDDLVCIPNRLRPPGSPPPGVP